MKKSTKESIVKSSTDIPIPQTIVCLNKTWLYDSTNGAKIKARNIQAYLRTKLGLPTLTPPVIPQKHRAIKRKGAITPRWIDNYYGN